MSGNRQEMMDALKLELQFLEKGTYEPSVHEPRKDLSVFPNSPSCLSYPLLVREHLCSECWLIDFVPPHQRNEAVPCHHIALNDRGDTIASMDKLGDNLRVQKAIRNWLRKKINELEADDVEM